MGARNQGIQRYSQFSSGSYIQTIHLSGKKLDHGGHGVGLDGIVQVNALGEQEA